MDINDGENNNRTMNVHNWYGRSEERHLSYGFEPAVHALRDLVAPRGQSLGSDPSRGDSSR